MPMTWGEALLQELQHEDITEGARKQQVGVTAGDVTDCKYW
jgi:hypothetical protein